MTERLISADSHVQLSHDDIKARLDPLLHPAYDDALGRFTAHVLETGAAKASLNATYTHPAAGRMGHSDPTARLADMDTDGVEAEVVYCEVSSYRYLYLMSEGWREATRAFNDTLFDYASADPGRLIVSYQIPIHDIDHAVAEVQRLAATGAKSLQLPVFPVELGFEDYWKPRYDPLWAAVQESGMPMCFHIGMNTTLDDLFRRDPTPQNGVTVPMLALSAAEPLGMWLLTGVLERFPDLKLVFVEPGLGWLAWYLFTVDDLVLRQGYQFPELHELPSYYFHRNLHATVIDEPDALDHLRHRIGVESILWSTDYPHPVSTWPNSQTLVAERFAGMPTEEKELILHGNAERVWAL